MSRLTRRLVLPLGLAGLAAPALAQQHRPQQPARRPATPAQPQRPARPAVPRAGGGPLCLPLVAPRPCAPCAGPGSGRYR